MNQSPSERNVSGARHVGGVALRRAGVDPAHDGGDLVVVQRAIVLVVADADGLVEMPRRHVAVRDALADRLRPRTRFFVGDERHRRRRALVMAGLAALLKNRRDVFRERRRCGLRLATRKSVSPSPLDGDLHLRVGPAAVVAEVAGRLARAVVDDRLEDVVAGLAERRGRRRLAARRASPRRARTAPSPGPRNLVQNTVRPTGAPRRAGRPSSVADTVSVARSAG